MCISPSFIYVYRGASLIRQPMGCRRCRRCKDNRVSDWTGRALGEAATSDWVCTVTLTYRHQEDGSHKVVNKAHFQDFVRSLRKRGHNVRYLVTAEYGKQATKRAHFHAILFGTGRKPGTRAVQRTGQRVPATLVLPSPRCPRGATVSEWPQEQRFHADEWPYGHIWADWRLDDKTVRYVTKYITKDPEWFSMSKKPAIGLAFLLSKLRDTIASGIYPTSFEYRPPSSHGKKRYLITGRCREIYALEAARLAPDFKVGDVDAWFYRAQGVAERREFVRNSQELGLDPDELESNRPSARTLLSVLADKVAFETALEGERYGDFAAFARKQADKAAFADYCRWRDSKEGQDHEQARQERERTRTAVERSPFSWLQSGASRRQLRALIGAALYKIEIGGANPAGNSVEASRIEAAAQRIGAIRARSGARQARIAKAERANARRYPVDLLWAGGSTECPQKRRDHQGAHNGEGNEPCDENTSPGKKQLQNATSDE